MDHSHSQASSTDNSHQVNHQLQVSVRPIISAGEDAARVATYCTGFGTISIAIDNAWMGYRFLGR
jgi:hypothetical protein